MGHLEENGWVQELLEAEGVILSAATSRYRGKSTFAGMLRVTNDPPMQLAGRPSRSGQGTCFPTNP